MRSVPRAVATGLISFQRQCLHDDPVATAPGTDFTLIRPRADRPLLPCRRKFRASDPVGLRRLSWTRDPTFAASLSSRPPSFRHFVFAAAQILLRPEHRRAW